jgi:hypothetical protein
MAASSGLYILYIFPELLLLLSGVKVQAQEYIQNRVTE